jgi:F-box protein 11
MDVSIKYCDNCGATNRPDAKFCYACGQPQITPVSTATGLLVTFHELKQRYRILEKLGQGGFGAIYKVEDLLFNKTVRAVKEMSMHNLFEQEVQQAIAAFKKEAMLLANLSHSNLPKIYDHFEDRGRWYLVMDYLHGETLEERLDKTPTGKLAIMETLQIALQLCDVLGYLHAHQPPIIFRDLKPGNVMLTADNHLYLIDFGIARFFTPGQSKDTITLGTPGYAAPEQYGRMQTTNRSDIYSLGATLYHVISGIYPGLNPFLFQPLGLDSQISGYAALEALIMQMLEMQESKRPTNIDIVRQELQRIQQMLLSVPILGIPTRPTVLVPSDTTQAVPVSLADPPPSLIVAQHGGGNYTTLGEAIQNADPGAFIFVHEGVYRESLVLYKDVEIMGNGPKEQIILESNNNHGIVVQTNRAVIRGLTMHCQAGKTTGQYHALVVLKGEVLVEDCDITSQSASGVVAYNPETKLMIRYCAMHHSAANGLAFYDDAHGTIEYCDIFQNDQSQVTIVTGGNPVFRHCTIYDSPEHGISMRNKGQGTFEDCDIHHNADSGIAITSHSNPLLLRCRIHHNQRYGVTVRQEGKGSLQDCEIYANTADNVLIATESTPYLYLCKIHHSEQCGITIKNNGQGTIEYSEIRTNKLANIAIASGGDPLVHYCTISDGEQDGIMVDDSGRGTIDQCNISGNKGQALNIASQSTVTLKRITM